MKYLYRSASQTACVRGGADTIHSKANLSQFLQGALARAQCITDATGLAIAVIEEKQLLCCARWGENAPDLGVPLKPGSGISGECFRRGNILHCVDAETDPRVSVSVCQQLGIRSIVALPLVHDRTVIGVFEVFSSQTHAFSNRQIDALEVLSHLIAVHLRDPLAMEPNQLDDPAMSQRGSAASQSAYEPSRTREGPHVLPAVGKVKPKTGRLLTP